MYSICWVAKYTDSDAIILFFAATNAMNAELAESNTFITTFDLMSWLLLWAYICLKYQSGIYKLSVEYNIPEYLRGPL